MPRSSDAFSSNTAALTNSAPNISCARHIMLVVFPVPGGPCVYERCVALVTSPGSLLNSLRLEVCQEGTPNYWHTPHTAMIMFGRFPAFAMAFSRDTTGSLPTTSLSCDGFPRYGEHCTDFTHTHTHTHTHIRTPSSGGTFQPMVVPFLTILLCLCNRYETAKLRRS